MLNNRTVTDQAGQSQLLKFQAGGGVGGQQRFGDALIGVAGSETERLNWRFCRVFAGFKNISQRNKVWTAGEEVAASNAARRLQQAVLDQAAEYYLFGPEADLG